MLLMFVAAGIYGVYALFQTIGEMDLFVRRRSEEIPAPRITEMPRETLTASEIPLKPAQ